DERLELRQPRDSQPHAEAVRRRPGSPSACARDRQLARRAGARQDRHRAYGGRHRVSGIAAGGVQGGAADVGRVLAGYREIARGGQAAAQGGGGRRAQVRADEPERRPALQVCRHLADRRVEQGRTAGHAARAADRAVLRRAASRHLRGDRGLQLSERGEPAHGHRQVPAALGLRRELRQLRRPEGGCPLSGDPPRDRFRQAASDDPRVRKVHSRHPGAHADDAVVESHHSRPVVCEGLEDQPEPLPQSGLGQRVARQVGVPRFRDVRPQPLTGIAARSGRTQRMYRYIVNRVLLVIPTLVGAAALVFVLMRLIPGDICVVRLGSGGGSVDPRAVALCHAELGLDRPLILQFLDFVWGFFRLDFGISMWSGKPVTEEIAAPLPISLEIAVMATVVAILIAIPLGTISALKQNSWIDHLVRTVAIAGIATPSFWLGIVSILVVLDISHAIFGAPWMPPIDYVPFWQDPLRNLSMVILPALTVGYRYSAVTMRMTRSAILEALREDYIRTARAKGLVERLIVNRHALKNALLPVVTLIGIEFAFLIGGLVVTEQVFNLNGVGRLFVLAVQNQDYTLTQALVMLTVAI